MQPGQPEHEVHGVAGDAGCRLRLELDAGGGQERKDNRLAIETGNVVLVPSSGPQIRLQTIGVQHPVGPQTSAHAKGLTRGTWTVIGGNGSGTYTFTTERNGSTFTKAVLQLSGTAG